MMVCRHHKESFNSGNLAGIAKHVVENQFVVKTNSLSTKWV